MKHTAMFLMTGDAHSAYLAVALHTLRAHYSGDIEVYAFEQSFEHVNQLCQDPRIAATCILYKPEYDGKNCQEVNKIDIIRKKRSSGVREQVVYLDADTIICQSIASLFSMSEAHQFVGVQFCNWTMNVTAARNRVARLIGIEGIDQDCVQKALERSMPSYNSGIFAADTYSEVLDTWHDWTYKARKIFIAGETALHAVAQKHKILTALNGVYNCSPKFQSPYLDDADVAIWHGHGDCFVRPSKSVKAVELWWPRFKEVMRLDIGNIQSWIDAVPNQCLFDLRTQ